MNIPWINFILIYLSNLKITKLIQIKCGIRIFYLFGISNEEFIGEIMKLSRANLKFYLILKN